MATRKYKGIRPEWYCKKYVCKSGKIVFNRTLVDVTAKEVMKLWGLSQVDCILVDAYNAQSIGLSLSIAESNFIFDLPQFGPRENGLYDKALLELFAKWKRKTKKRKKK